MFSSIGVLEHHQVSCITTNGLRQNLTYDTQIWNSVSTRTQMLSLWWQLYIYIYVASLRLRRQYCTLDNARTLIKLESTNYTVWRKSQIPPVKQADLSSHKERAKVNPFYENNNDTRKRCLSIKTSIPDLMTLTWGLKHNKQLHVLLRHTLLVLESSANNSSCK